MSKQICPTCGCPMKLTREEVEEIFKMSASVDELAKVAREQTDHMEDQDREDTQRRNRLVTGRFTWMS